jgi:hypothetical protein
MSANALQEKRRARNRMAEISPDFSRNEIMRVFSFRATPRDDAKRLAHEIAPAGENLEQGLTMMREGRTQWSHSNG